MVGVGKSLSSCSVKHVGCRMSVFPELLGNAQLRERGPRSEPVTWCLGSTGSMAMAPSPQSSAKPCLLLLSPGYFYACGPGLGVDLGK